MKSDSRLNETALAGLPTSVARPRYKRSDIATGVAHFGPGAFHRAHQAWFLEQLLPHDPRWGIAGIALRSPDVRDALAAQDNLYTLAVRDETVSFQVIGAIREMLVAPEDPQATLRRLSARSTALVTITVTEKGYCLAADGTLDSSHADIRRDLQSPRSPASVIGFLVEALRRRRDERTPAFTVMGCDNLADNGVKLGRAVVQFAERVDPDLARWIEGEVFFPRTMVDSITPATTDALRESVATALGVEDRWPVQREPFAQWVIESDVGVRAGRGAAPAPDWEGIGVTVTRDVAAYDRAKLRLVNGAHSTLAYAGILLGHRTVSEAMGDADLSALTQAMMTHDIVPTLSATAGLDLNRYVESIVQRFRNPGMRHELAQIACDGSQKLPVRILGTIRDALSAGRPIDRLCVPLAAWMRFVRRAAMKGDRLNDPLATRLADIGRACSGHASTDVPLFLGLESIFPADLRNEPRFTKPLAALYAGENTANLTLPPRLSRTFQGRALQE